MSDIVERLRAKAALFAGGGPGSPTEALLKEAADELEARDRMHARDRDLLNALEADRARLRALLAEREARLEIDHSFQLVDGDFVRVEVPPELRDTWPDGITCRDETIKLLEENAQRRQWQPIETAPRDGTRIILAFPKINSANDKWANVRLGKWRNGNWHLDAAGHYRTDCTDWQPLPTPPSPHKGG